MTESSLKALREQRMLSRAELAREAGVSPLTIDRIEQGRSCRQDTLRKIILALGYTLADRERFLPDVAVSTSKEDSAKP